MALLPKTERLSFLLKRRLKSHSCGRKRKLLKKLLSQQNCFFQSEAKGIFESVGAGECQQQ